jgi:hypothetical protein
VTKPTRAVEGAVSHDGRPMKYAHGQHSAYVLDRCRCEPCRLSNRAYEQERAQRIAPAFVGADATRKHVEFLSANGVGLKQISRLTGVSSGVLTKLVYGDGTRKMGPSKRIRQATAEKILAVMPSHAAAGSKQPAGPSWVLIDEMIAAGVTKTAIARYLGQNGPGLQLSRTLMLRRHVVKIREMHDRWRAGELVLRERGHRHIPVAAVVAPPVREPDYQDRAQILVDLAEILEARNEQPWRADAACRNRPVHVWFPGRGDPRCEAKAKLICRSCIVRRECLSANMSEPAGIFGGLTARERREIRSAA